MTAARTRRPARTAWIVVRVVAFVGLAYLAVQIALAHSDELSGAATYFDHLHPGWIVAAVAAEAVSIIAFAALQRVLLRAGRVEVGMGRLVPITLAGNAMTNSLPAGGAFASVFAYRQFRRNGADEALATWTLIAVTGTTALTLGLIALAGIAVAGQQGPVAGIGLLVALLMVAPAVGGAILLWPQLLAIPGRPALAVSRRFTGRPRGDPAAVLAQAVSRLEAVSPRGDDWLFALVCAGSNWAADAGCLVLAFAAVGAPIPLRGLLLAYGAGQVAANLPITPGGLGVVEGSLTVVLVAFGGSTAETVAAVLLYRVISFWCLLPIGWIAWAGLWFQARRDDPHRALEVP